MRKSSLSLSLSLSAALLVFAADAHAQVLHSAAYNFPDPANEIGDPSPAVWTRSGNFNPLPDTDRGGLQISDRTDRVSFLLYSNTWPASVNPSNAAVLRAIVQSDAIGDSFAAGFGGWAPDDTTGFRLILDDSQRRLTFGVGRDPVTFARQVVIFGAPAVAPIPFAWDNGFFNEYEIARLANGDFRVTVTNGDPDAAVPTVTVLVPAASLASSTGAAQFVWGAAAPGGGNSYWNEVHGIVSADQKILFTSARDGNLELYSMNPDDTGQTGVTTDPAVDAFPAWSPDRAKIAFTSNRAASFNFDVHVMNAVGTGVTRLTNNPAIEAEPAGSADSSQIAFTSNRDGFFSAEIYVMDANGGGQTRLTNNSALDTSPDW